MYNKYFMIFLCLDLDDRIAEMSAQTGKGRWECTQCGKLASQRTDLKKHIESFHMNLSLPCEVCFMIFKTRHTRFAHLRNVHGISNK